MWIKNSPSEFGIQLTDPFIQKYLTVWMSLLLLATITVLVKRKSLLTKYAGYFDFLFIKWKLITFGVACLFVSIAGYWTDDESWDLISGFGMSIFTYFFAPLSVGVVYRFLYRKETLLNVFLVIAFSFFSFSWFYDGYLLLRDGSYTQRWYGNLILSSAIYLCAGFFWNLEIGKDNKILFGFSRSDWPRPSPYKGLGIASLVAMPFGAIAVYFLVGFVGWDFEFWSAEAQLMGLQFIFAMTGGLFCPLIIAFFYWRNSKPREFPFFQGLLLIVPSLFGLFVFPILSGLMQEGMSTVGDNPGAIGGMTIAWMIITPFYWIALYLLFRYLKYKESPI